VGGRQPLECYLARLLLILVLRGGSGGVYRGRCRTASPWRRRRSLVPRLVVALRYRAVAEIDGVVAGRSLDQVYVFVVVLFAHTDLLTVRVRPVSLPAGV
jgi:hypothetical protein